MQSKRYGKDYIKNENLLRINPVYINHGLFWV